MAHPGGQQSKLIAGTTDGLLPVRRTILWRSFSILRVGLPVSQLPAFDFVNPVALPAVSYLDLSMTPSTPLTSPNANPTSTSQSASHVPTSRNAHANLLSCESCTTIPKEPTAKDNKFRG